VPLKFDLNQFETLHLGKTVIRSWQGRAYLELDGAIPVLRGREYLREEKAQTAMEKLYRCVQQMYLEEASDKYQARYLQLAAQAIREDPLLAPNLQAADELIKSGDFYKALKRLKKLIQADAFGVPSHTSVL
jgi:flagellar protein FlbT